MTASIPEDSRTAPFRPLQSPPPAVEVEHRPDGSVLLRCPYALGEVSNDVLTWLRTWSVADPGRTMLAERDGDRAWRRIGYGQMRLKADAIGQALLDRGLRPGSTLMVLSGNSIEHAVMVLGAMTVGIIAVPVTPAYSLASKSLEKLRHVASLVEPAAVFAQDGTAFAGALRLLHDAGARVVVAKGEPGTPHDRFDDLASTTVTPAVDAAYARVGPQTVAKILFTSGSTGQPKGVINTHQMMCVNQAMTAALRTAAGEAPPVTLSWLPWNHTMGGNALFNRNMRLGGTLYLDDGRPLPGEFERTIANLREVLPATFSNVPAAFGMLADALEADDDFNRRFFAGLESLSYAAAALPDALLNRIQRLSVRATGMRIPFTSGYGSTETAPMITMLYWVSEGSNLIGLPAPGVEIKLAPVAASRYEVRVRGPNVTPGYYRQPDLSAQAFDDEGFYCMGDAARLVDPADPLQGLMFAGRVKEDFKLQSGTWVATGPLRAAVLHATAPMLQDMVIAGHDRDTLGALAWPNLPACRALMGQPKAGLADIAASRVVQESIAAALARHNAANPASSLRIARLMLLTEPASAEDGEINDKAYINAATVLARRSALIDALYASTPSTGVVLPAGAAHELAASPA
ncbi:feruloyl-CoA synthase [Variovorax saccharolyticus]|uniref:feruloyl-CoA synthase n=1 Tax=Variovorax saccharolyticus TaxID=3053516 RepID=UPI002575DFE0|nr:feruloyl-CoA synthase [Variovorax sp. J22R187]MDM0021903.1 feruloyl-CoA synthase [Variovorax sp. J22R187]